MRNKHIKTVLSDFGSEYTGKTSQKYYINTRFQSIPPEFTTDLSDSVRSIASQDLIDFYLKQVLVKENKDKHLYMILGGSGMGKTSFVVQLVKKYYHRYSWGSEPYNIVVIPGGCLNITERIVHTTDKPNSVLILDALDECSEAIEDFNSFIVRLEEAYQEFHLVIITCRTQFFEGNDDIRKASVLPVLSRERGFLYYEHQYVSPFTDQEIETFLKKRYFFHLKRKRIAEAIVHQNNTIMVRPLLLSYIDDLVKSNSVLYSRADVYHALIDRWIEREVNFEPDEAKRDTIRNSMNKMSLELAEGIYNNWIRNGGLFMPSDEYDILEKRYIDTGVVFHYRGRSLINWDAEKNRKFAHKSFLEYFLAKKMIQDASFSVNTNGLNDVEVFYSDMCAALLKKEVSGNRIRFSVIKTPIPFKYMSILSNPQCEYRHLIQRPDMLVIDWKNMTSEMLEWLKSQKAFLLVIKNFISNDFALELPSLSSIKAIYFYQSRIPPSQKLQKALSSKRIRYSISSDTWQEKLFESVFWSFSFRNRQAIWFSSNKVNFKN